MCLSAVAAVMLLGTAPHRALGQSPQEVVERLNTEAMEAYNNLEIDKAGGMLEEAVRIAYEGGVPAPLLALVNLNLGVVIIGGLGDNDGGLGYFVQAVCTDPNVQLDPLTSTPDIQSVFEVAHQQAAAGACQGSSSGQQAGPVGPAVPTPDQAVMHTVPYEHLAATPLPLYIEVDPTVRPKRAFLSYMGLGMDQWKRVPMYVYQNGFAYQIGCGQIFEPKISYFIEVENDDGEIVGVIASAAAPVELPVVSQRSQPPAALPGAEPPMSCSSGECPPGVKGCEKTGTAAILDSCDVDDECQDGLECADGECMLIGARGTEGPDYDEGEDWSSIEGDSGPAGFGRGFFQIGMTVGMSFVQSGMPADRPAPTELVFVDVPDPPGSRPGRYVTNAPQYVFDGGQVVFPEPGTINEDRLTSWVPDADSADSLTATAGPLPSDCAADGTATGPDQFLASQNIDDLYPSSYCVRVRSAGLAPSLALRTAIGYFVTDRIALSALGRFAFSSGEGTLANLLLGARAEYMFSQPRPRGLMISAFVGGTFGQIQVQPPLDQDDPDAPFIKSGPIGGHVGANVRYRFHPNFGLYASPEFNILFPDLLMHIDVTALGVELAF